MPKPDPEGERLDELEDEVEELRGKLAEGRTDVKIELWDVSVQISSEESDIDHITDLAEDLTMMATERALVGEYQELEEQNLHSRLLGGD